MIKTVENFLKKYNIADKNVILGFSAGPDSCALALILAKLKNKFNIKITLAYFNHGWRKEALDEEEFTKNFAEKFDFNYVIEKASKGIKKSEEIARTLRYDFFKKTADKLNTDVVLLAHNKNDNIETLIYRVIKGTSVFGLASIPENRDIYFRPLLSVLKEDILKFLKDNNQNYMFDSSNNDEKYARNLIRNKLLPLFSKINSNYPDTIENLIQNAISTRKIVDDYISNIEAEIIKDNKINYSKYILLPPETRFEILNNFLFDKLKYRTRANLEKTDNFILNNQNSKMSLNKDEFLIVRNNKIYVLKNKLKSEEKAIIEKEGIFEFENKKFQIKKVKKPNIFPKDKENICYLNFDFPLIVRHRNNGDKFSPYGLKGTMKLKDYLINQKFEQDKKDDLILFCKDKEVVWIVGEKISENYKATLKNCYEIKLI